MGPYGKKITELRLSKKWSQKQLAAELGIKEATVSKYETDKMSNPTIDTLEKLAETLDTDILFFILNYSLEKYEAFLKAWDILDKLVALDPNDCDHYMRIIQQDYDATLLRKGNAPIAQRKILTSNLGPGVKSRHHFRNSKKMSPVSSRN